jgi:hypothetical protein
MPKGPVRQPAKSFKGTRPVAARDIAARAIAARAVTAGAS